jgi:hypothetical protein
VVEIGLGCGSSAVVFEESLLSQGQQDAKHLIIDAYHHPVPERWLGGDRHRESQQRLHADDRTNPTLPVPAPQTLAQSAHRIRAFRAEDYEGEDQDDGHLAPRQVEHDAGVEIGGWTLAPGPESAGPRSAGGRQLGGGGRWRGALGSRRRCFAIARCRGRLL